MLLGADVQLAGADEQVLASEVRVSLVFEGELAVYSDKLVHRGRIHVEDHVPAWPDVHVFALFGNFASWPIG